MELTSNFFLYRGLVHHHPRNYRKFIWIKLPPPPSTLPSKSVRLVFLIVVCRYESLTANLYLLISKCKSCMSFNRTVPIWKNIKRRWSSPGLRLGRHSNSIHRMHLYTRRNLINPNLVSFIFLKYFNNLKNIKSKNMLGVLIQEYVGGTHTRKENFFNI